MSKIKVRYNRDRFIKWRWLHSLLLGRPNALLSISHRVRSTKSGRFSGPHDWGRLIALGVLLVDLAALGFRAPSLWTRTGYWPGLAATFGGLLIAIIVLKLSRPGIYWDWLGFGVLQIVLGIASKDLAEAADAAMFYATMFASAFLMIWIAMTISSGKGRAWLGAGGLACLAVASLGSLDYAIRNAIGVDTVLLTTLVLTGLSIIGLGISIRSDREMRDENPS